MSEKQPFPQKQNYFCFGGNDWFFRTFCVFSKSRPKCPKTTISSETKLFLFLRKTPKISTFSKKPKSRPFLKNRNMSVFQNNTQIWRFSPKEFRHYLRFCKRLAPAKIIAIFKKLDIWCKYMCSFRVEITCAEIHWFAVALLKLEQTLKMTHFYEKNGFHVGFWDRTCKQGLATDFYWLVGVICEV